MGEFSTHKNTVEAQCSTGFGSAQLVRKYWDEPIDSCGATPYHHVELALLPTPQSSAACFIDHWNPQRFEPFGEVFLLPADYMVHARSTCRQQNSVVCFLRPEEVDRWLERDVRWHDCHLQSMLNITNQRVRGLLFQIGEELRHPGFAKETMVELMTAQTVIEIARHLHSTNQQQVAGKLAPWRIKAIEERVCEGDQQPTLAELADLCQLSVRHLTRAFRATLGQSIGSYIADRRSVRAKRMIAAGMSIKAVAYTLGFSAPSNFTAAFVRATGETPSQYRLRVRGGPLPAAVMGNTRH